MLLKRLHASLRATSAGVVTSQRAQIAAADFAHVWRRKAINSLLNRALDELRSSGMYTARKRVPCVHDSVPTAVRWWYRPRQPAVALDTAHRR